MANGLFTAFKAKQLGDAGVSGPTIADLESDTLIKAILVDTGTDAPNRDTDQDIADIAAGARVAVATLTGTEVTFAGNVVTWDAADTTFTAVTGASAEALLIYNDSAGAETTDLLICLFDTAITGLPVTPNGGDIIVQWNASGIFTW